MRGWLRSLATELRHGTARWMTLAVAGTTVALLWLDHTADWGGRWNALGSFMRELIIVLGPVCVVLGAWQGGRARLSGVGELLASTSRTAMQRHSVEIVAVWLAITTGVLLGWASAAWTIALVGGWGSSAAAWYVLGLIPALAAYTTAGYLVGALAPWRIVAPIAGAATYVGVGLVMWQSDNVAVAMGGGWLGGTDGYAFDLDALLLSMAVLSLAAVTLWAAVSWERRPGASWRWATVLVPAATATGVLFPLTVQASDSGRDGLRPTDGLLACTDDLPEVCVYAEDRLLLPETVERARPVLDRLASIPGAPDRAMPMRDPRDISVLGVEPGATTPWGGVDEEWGGQVHVDVYSLFAPETYCPTGRFAEAPRPVRRAFRSATHLLVGWFDPESAQYFDAETMLQEEPGARDRELIERFLGSTDRQRDSYAAAVWAAAQDCDIAAVRAAGDLLAPPATATDR